MESNHYIYVLECNDGTYYTGYTNDLKKRIVAHNEKKGAKYTKARTPVKLIYSEVFATKSEALKKEYSFKQLTRKQKEAYIEERQGEQNETTKKFSPRI